MNTKELNAVVLAYARPDTFARVIKACEKNLHSVKVMMDFPENDLISKKQEEIVDIINNLSIDCTLTRRTENYGLVRSVLTTIEDELQLHDHVVLLEDDCMPDKKFFSFVSNSLKHYKDDPSVSSICGTVSKCRFNPWGWATWSHKWKYETLSKKQILDILDLDPSLRDFLENNNVEHSIWSLNWLASQYKNGTVAHMPQNTLVQNIGVDESGVHSPKKGYTSWLLSQIKEK